METHGRLEGRQAFLLHGQPVHRLYYSLVDAPDEVLQCQLTETEFDTDLAPGDPIVITMLLRTVLEIRHLR